MKAHRHPHPHIDPRQPRHGARPGTNPPVFAWKPVGDGARYWLTVARDAAFTDVCLARQDLREALCLPEKAFAPGTYYWKWGAAEAVSEVFCFEITAQAVVLEVPQAAEWLQRFPAQHPRLYIRPQAVDALRASRAGSRAERWQALQAEADALLAQPHEIDEPPFLPDRTVDYEAFFAVWFDALWTSRRFVKGAETLALAYLASGETSYARAACRRMASISRWDPEGSSHIAHNDEAHMSVIWHGPTACDWVWDQFTAAERALVIDQFRRRGEITYEYMHDRGAYGVSRFDSHAGREIVFLAQIAFTFYEHIPQAQTWLDWLRPVLCGIWPIWAGDDGAWAEGPSYGLAYVRIMTMFATALKRGTGVDLYRRPFWKHHAEWRRRCLPPYAEWIGFGDHSERWGNKWRDNADLVELIDRETGAHEFADYVADFRAEAETCYTPVHRQMPGGSAQRYLSAPAHQGDTSGRPAACEEDKVLSVFADAGWAAIRTNVRDADRDIAMIFRSSPFGAVSHSHASNNDFVIHVAGKVMAMPSGYYAGYGSAHHGHWVWHTKAHNCITLSGAPQLLHSHDSVGAIENAFEDDRLTYFRGNADASYQDRAARCRRHVLFLKGHDCFVMIDEFVAKPGVVSSVQWNIHSWNPFAVDRERRTFLVERGSSSLAGHFIYGQDAFFSLSEGWDPPPASVKDDAQWLEQYHLRFTPVQYADRVNLGVVLCPGHRLLPRARPVIEQLGTTQVAHIGQDLVLLGRAGQIEYEEISTEALARLCIQGAWYTLDDEGLIEETNT